MAGGPSAAAGTAGALLLRFPALEKKVRQRRGVDVEGVAGGAVADTMLGQMAVRKPSESLRRASTFTQSSMLS